MSTMQLESFLEAMMSPLPVYPDLTAWTEHLYDSPAQAPSHRDVAEALSQMITYIGENGWVKGEMRRGAAVCMMGAFAYRRGRDIQRLLLEEHSLLGTAVSEAIIRVIPVYRANVCDWQKVVDFNDSPGTVLIHVMTALAHARDAELAAAQAEEAAAGLPDTVPAEFAEELVPAC